WVAQQHRIESARSPSTRYWTAVQEAHRQAEHMPAPERQRFLQANDPPLGADVIAEEGAGLHLAAGTLVPDSGPVVTGPGSAASVPANATTGAHLPDARDGVQKAPPAPGHAQDRAATSSSPSREAGDVWVEVGEYPNAGRVRVTPGGFFEWKGRHYK